MPPRSSLPSICIALGLADPESLLAHARDEYNAGERFFEFRLDYLTQPEKGVAAIRKFLAKHPDCVLLATCRRRQNQGRFTGSVEPTSPMLPRAGWLRPRAGRN
jgi:3-dehydroquinate dehydratase/shikimate dehydrogenase